MQFFSMLSNIKKPLLTVSMSLLAGVTLTACKSDHHVAAGGAHTLAYTDGQLYAWGRNNNNQIGNGDTGKNSGTPVAVDLPLPEGVKVADIQANLNFTLLLDTAGDVWAWGRNNEGTMGNGSTDEVPKPTKIDALDEVFVIDIAAGQRHGLALTQLGSVWAWGNNAKGQLGVEPNADVSPRQDNVLTPIKVLGVNGIKDVEAGGSFSLARNIKGQLYVWGDNDNGQLGIDPDVASFRYTPDMVEGLAGKIKAMAAGKDHVVALLKNGTMQAWGLNFSGQLGNGTDENAYRPVQVDTAVKMRSISASGNFNLAISRDRKLYSWGQNVLGSLGTGQPDNEPKPVLVEAFTQPVMKAVNGLGHSIVSTKEEDQSTAFWTFGLNSFGQVGVADAPFQNLSPLRLVFPANEE